MMDDENLISVKEPEAEEKNTTRTRIIYEDELEWLKEALMKRPMPRGGGMEVTKRIQQTLYLLNHEDALYDFMMWLKYGVKPNT